jgi:hypothetical protein
MAQCDVLLQLMLIMTAESIPATATAASAAVTVAVLTRAAMAKATTASSACWHHSATVGAVFSPVWA